MPQEIFWLVLTTFMTALLWVPYIVNQIAVRGLVAAMANPAPGDKPLSTWADRASRAHKNGVENLVVFAPLALSVHVLGVGDAVTATACAVYFFARLAHYIIYTAGIPIARTLSFAVGAVAQVTLALRLFGLA